MKYWLLLCALTILSCSPKSDSIKALPDKVPGKDVVDDDQTDDYVPQADILFVVDNSGSMGTHQSNLSRNINLFVNEFLRAPVVDYNIAVVTTDVDGALSNPCCGKFMGLTKVVNKNTPSGANVLSNNLLVGTRGSGEEAPFDAVKMALDPALLSSWNKGFSRTNSTLAIIFITDAEDQSAIEPLDLYNLLLTFKGGLAKKVYTFGAVIPTSETRCARDAWDPPTRIEDFLKMFPHAGNNEMNLCATDFGKSLADAASKIVEAVGSRIYLSRRPDPKTLRVSYGGIDLPNRPITGWTYDSFETAIVLGKDIDWSVQPSGSQVKVHYKSATR